MIAAHADVCPWTETGAALADQNITGDNDFAVVLLDTKALAPAVPSVSSGSLSFFMCHSV